MTYWPKGEPHPAKSMTKPQKRDFELIATGKRPLGGHMTINKLKAAGLIKDGPPAVVGHNSFGPVTLPTWELTTAAQRQWNQFQKKLVGFREPGEIKPAKSWLSEQRTCKAKIRYAEKPHGNERAMPYKCDFCGGWHLTSRAQPMDKPPLHKNPALRLDRPSIKSASLDKVVTSRPIDSAAKRVGGKLWRDDDTHS